MNPMTISPQLARAMHEHRKNDRTGDALRSKASQKEAIKGWGITKVTQENQLQAQLRMIFVSTVSQLSGMVEKMAGKAVKGKPDQLNERNKKIAKKAVPAFAQSQATSTQKTHQKATEIRGQAVNMRQAAASRTAGQTVGQMNALMDAYKVEA